MGGHLRYFGLGGSGGGANVARRIRALGSVAPARIRPDDGRVVGFPNDDYTPDLVWLDHAKLKVTREVKPGDEFEYVFDMGDNWLHRCVADRAKVDPVSEYGIVPPGRGGGAGLGLDPGSVRPTLGRQQRRSLVTDQSRRATTLKRICANSGKSAGHFAHG